MHNLSTGESKFKYRRERETSQTDYWTLVMVQLEFWFPLFNNVSPNARQLVKGEIARELNSHYSLLLLMNNEVGRK